MITVKLWEFSLPDIDDVLHLYSLRNDEDFLRAQFDNQVHGTYIELYKKGNIKKITSIDDIPLEYRNYYPYNSEELTYYSFQLTINEFFDPPSNYRESL